MGGAAGAERAEGGAKGRLGRAQVEDPGRWPPRRDPSLPPPGPSVNEIRGGGPSRRPLTRWACGRARLVCGKRGRRKRPARVDSRDVGSHVDTGAGRECADPPRKSGLARPDTHVRTRTSDIALPASLVRHRSSGIARPASLVRPRTSGVARPASHVRPQKSGLANPMVRRVRDRWWRRAMVLMRVAPTPGRDGVRRLRRDDAD